MPHSNSDAPPNWFKTALLTVVALVAFAANSLLCRMALGQQLIDATSFTTVRLVAGALTLCLIMLVRGQHRNLPSLDWRAAIMLFAYMVGFSYAYISLSTGTGALILFGAVQLSMFGVALKRGERFSLLSSVGLALAVLGLIVLVAPGVTAPDPGAAALMAMAGIAWGFYTLLGGGIDPLAATAKNFVAAAPLAIVLSLIFSADIQFSTRGLILAAVAGAITSGLGYAIWYSALNGLSASRAAVAQLAVPAIAAFGGIVYLGEELTPRIVLASVATVGGVWLALAQRQ